MLLFLSYLYTQPINRTYCSSYYKVLLYIYYQGYGIRINLNNMPPRAALVTTALVIAITLGLGNTSINKGDS